MKNECSCKKSRWKMPSFRRIQLKTSYWNDHLKSRTCHPTLVSLSDSYWFLAYGWHSIPSKHFSRHVETVLHHLTSIITAREAATTKKSRVSKWTVFHCICTWLHSRKKCNCDEIWKVHITMHKTFNSKACNIWIFFPNICIWKVAA